MNCGRLYAYISYIYSVEYACKLWTGLARLPFQLRCDFLLPNGKEVLISPSPPASPTPPLFYNYVLGFSVGLCLFSLFPTVIQFYCELSIYFLFNSQPGTRPKGRGQAEGRRWCLADRWVLFLRGSSSMKMCAPLTNNRKNDTGSRTKLKLNVKMFISLLLCLATRRMRNVSCPP